MGETPSPIPLPDSFSNINPIGRAILYDAFGVAQPGQAELLLGIGWNDAEKGQKLRTVMDVLFQSHEACDFEKQLKKARISEQEIPALLQSEGMEHFIVKMLEGPQAVHAHFQISELLLFNPVKQGTELERILQDRYGMVGSKSNFKIEPFYEEWSLCDKAEWRMYDAFDDDAVIALNGDESLVKYLGKLIAVATKTVRMQNGQVILAGTWIAPTDHPSNTEKILEDAFVKRDNAQVNLSQGEWVILRKINSSNLNKAKKKYENRSRDVLEESKRYRDKEMLGKLPHLINGKSRQVYRKDNKEYF